jgi:hypothetical protein
MSGRSMPFRSGDDAARAAVAPLLDELRGELLVLPRDEIVEKHLDMMAFEQRVVATPRAERRPARRVLDRPRRTAVILGCITATIASCGLSAAGALPEPLQHITDSIAHTLGVPQPHDTGTSTGAPATTPDTTVPVVQPRTDTPTTQPASTTTPAKDKPRTHATTPTTEPAPPTSTLPEEPQGEPAFPARPTDPGERTDPTPTTTPTTPPSNNSDNTPAGFPTDWRDQAADALTTRLVLCSWRVELSSADCPQSAVAPGAENVTWRLLSDPSRTSAAVARTTKDASGQQSTLVTVYERFRMVATYTLPDTGTQQYLAYSSGIAEGTMTWTGEAFGNVQLTPGSVVGHVMPGVTVPNFSRPNLWDFQVAYKVQRAFEHCTATGTPDSRCPAGGLLDAPSTNQSTLDGDVLPGSEVSFDGETGLYRVKGPYSLTPPSGPSVTGTFTATIFNDGSSLTILTVTGS